MSRYSTHTYFKFRKSLIHFERFFTEWKGMGIEKTEQTVTFPLVVDGIKELKVQLTTNLYNGKGFIQDIDYISSAKIGENRKEAIQEQLDALFSHYLLDGSQPEGLYEDKGKFIPRISSQGLAPLFSYVKHESWSEPKTVRVFEYDEGIVTTEYGDYAYIDENNIKYTYLREITPFERQNGILYTWRIDSRDESFISIGDMDSYHRKQIKNLEVFDDRVLKAPTIFPVGTVIEDVKYGHMAKVLKHNPSLDGESQSFQAIMENEVTEDNFVKMSSRWIVAESQDFESKVEHLVFSLDDSAFYRTVFDRPHYMLVENIDKSKFMPTFHSKFPFKSLKKEKLVVLEHDIERCLERGQKRCESDPSAEILFRLLTDFYFIHDSRQRYVFIGILAKTHSEMSDITLRLLKSKEANQYADGNQWKNEFILNEVH